MKTKREARGSYGNTEKYGERRTPTFGEAEGERREGRQHGETRILPAGLQYTIQYFNVVVNRKRSRDNKPEGILAKLDQF